MRASPLFNRSGPTGVTVALSPALFESRQTSRLARLHGLGRSGKCRHDAAQTRVAGKRCDEGLSHGQALGIFLEMDHPVNEEKLLQALQNEEQKTNQKMQQKQARPVNAKIQKDW